MFPPSSVNMFFHLVLSPPVRPPALFVLLLLEELVGELGLSLQTTGSKMSLLFCFTWQKRGGQ